MKALLFALAMLPAMAFAQKYTYTKITEVTTGSDYFGFDKTEVTNKQGSVEIKDDVLHIDNKEFRVRQGQYKGTYKSRLYSFWIATSLKGETILAMSANSYTRYYYLVENKQGDAVAKNK
ncbi:MAG: hypothetical protein JST82_05490 [Bacteroidetes bacterium]|nr:hypothetical protein [Bacteroidota bacterium]